MYAGVYTGSKIGNMPMVQDALYKMGNAGSKLQYGVQHIMDAGDDTCSKLGNMVYDTFCTEGEITSAKLGNNSSLSTNRRQKL